MLLAAVTWDGTEKVMDINKKIPTVQKYQMSIFSKTSNSISKFLADFQLYFKIFFETSIFNRNNLYPDNPHN